MRAGDSLLVSYYDGFTQRSMMLVPRAVRRIEVKVRPDGSGLLRYQSTSVNCEAFLNAGWIANIVRWMEVNNLGSVYQQGVVADQPPRPSSQLKVVRETQYGATPSQLSGSGLRTGASPDIAKPYYDNSNTTNPEGGNEMSNQRHLLNLLQEHMTTATVHFIGQSTTEPGYTYKVHKDWNVQPGDFLVVDSPKSGICVGKVAKVDKAPRIDTDASFTYKWAMQKVSRAFYDRQLEKEKLFLEQLAEVDVIHKREAMMEKATKALGEDTPARKAFDAAVKQLSEV